MRKFYSKLIALVLACTLCFGCVADYAFAAESGSTAEAAVGNETETDVSEQETQDEYTTDKDAQIEDNENTDTTEAEDAESVQNAEDSSESEEKSENEVATWGTAPVLTGTSASPNGAVKISWETYNDASGYAVFRKLSDGNWSRIGTTTETTYSDNSSFENGTTYYYTVRAYRGSETEALDNLYNSAYWTSQDDTGLKVVYTEAPTLSSATNTATGVKVKWDSVSGATGYVVFRKTSGGSWTQVGTTTSTSYTDKTASYETSYRYTVRAYRGDQDTAFASGRSAEFWSGYDSTGLAAVFLKVPTLKTPVKALATGEKISWKAVSGASGYAVFRKTDDGTWKRIGTTTSTSYKDTTSLKNGTTYYYSVRAYRGTEAKALKNTYNAQYWSYLDSTGVKIVYLDAPALVSAKNTANGVKVKWSSVSGATGYVIFRKGAGTSWKQIGTTTSTSYTDKKASYNTSYRYVIRAYRGNKSTALASGRSAEYWSGYDTTGLSAVLLKVPTLKAKVKALGSGRQVSWKAVSGATGYAVFRKASGGSWKRIGTTTSTSYKDTSSLKNGTTYYYSVRAYRGSEAKALKNTYSAQYWSYLDTTGVKIIYVKSPTISSSSRSSSGIKIKWGSISGASGYAVYRKATGGSWKQLAVTTSTSYTDKTASSNKTYDYAVRAYRGSKSTALANLMNAKYWSGYNSHTVYYNQVTVIAGDSIMVGLYGTSYNGISKINISGSKYVVAAGSLNCKTMRTASRFSKGTGVQQMASYNPTRVYIMLGMNEVAWKSTASIKKDYADLIKAIKKSCPRAQIVVLALSPVTRSKASRSPGFSKSRNDNYNATIKAVAKANGCLYYDYTANFKDSSGYLKQSFSGGDGIHWNSSAYAEFGRAISTYDATLN